MPAADVRRGAVMLRIRDLGKAYGKVPQFEKAELIVTQGQRMGLLGINGAGKSTFMKCLAGVESPDDGAVEVSPGVKVLYVDQNPDWPDETTTRDALLGADDPRAKAMLAYYAAAASGVFFSINYNGQQAAVLYPLWRLWPQSSPRRGPCAERLPSPGAFLSSTSLSSATSTAL